MRITSLETVGFRNLGSWRLEPCAGINIICGENGQGKTNLLEAAGLFNGMRSFRGARNNQLIRHGEKFSRIEMGFFAAGREQSAKMIITPESREVTFRMTDKGIPFDPLQKPDPDITLSAEEREIGGLGIFITKKTMDTVTYAYENGENILTMIKKI